MWSSLGQLFRVRRTWRRASATGLRLMTLAVVILCLLHLRGQFNQNRPFERQLTPFGPLLKFFASSNSWPLDEQGCYPFKASSYFKLLHAESLAVDVAAFSDSFKDYFPFDHTSSNWAGLSGSGVWLESKQAYLTSTRMIRKPTDCKIPCVWPYESLIYLQARDKNYSLSRLRYETDSGLIIVPPEGRIVDIYDASKKKRTKGPEDARLILDDHGNPILSFNMADQVGRRYYSYNLTRGNLQHLVPGNDWDTKQKNWAPFFFNDTMHYVYSFNPLRILRCDRRGTVCSFISGESSSISGLRGGTPLIQYKSTHYYVGLARTTQYCLCGHVYRPNIVVLYVPPDDPSLIDLVYVSEDIDFNNTLLRPPFAPPGIDNYCESYLMPCGFLKWTFEDEMNSDTSHFIFSIQDTTNVVVEAKGLEKVIKGVIAITEMRRRQLKNDNKPWSAIGPALVQCAEKRLYNKCSSFLNTIIRA